MFLELLAGYNTPLPLKKGGTEKGKTYRIRVKNHCKGHINYWLYEQVETRAALFSQCCSCITTECCELCAGEALDIDQIIGITRGSLEKGR